MLIVVYISRGWDMLNRIVLALWVSLHAYDEISVRIKAENSHFWHS